MKRLKRIAKAMPGVSSLYHTCMALLLRTRPVENIFTDIFRGNKWRGKDSMSGLGSDADQTGVLVAELPSIFDCLKVRTLLDIPCGDFYWMKHVRRDGIEYIGADIVEDLVQQNARKFQAKNVRFRRLNLMKDMLPKVDLILCRDCLVHFSYKDILLALRNICNSGSTYLLATTFTDRPHNRDTATGQWRPLNMEHAPIGLPPPLKVIREACSEADGAFEDKSLGLWKVADIQRRLAEDGHPFF